MTGISDLATLLKEMSPRLSTDFFVFACVTDEQAIESLRQYSAIKKTYD